MALTEKEAQKNQTESSPRDHLANERTFLAWVRTGIAIMAFGFVVVRFSLFIKQLSIALNETLLLPNKGYSAIIGISLVGLGAVMTLLAYVRYKNIEKQLKNNSYFPSGVLSLLLTVCVLLVGIFLVLYLLPGL